jgi:predicted nucleic acid-binding protein
LIEMPIDQVIAELAGTARAHPGIATPDALIAATALRHRIPLTTHNRRLFDRAPELQVVAPD